MEQNKTPYDNLTLEKITEIINEIFNKEENKRFFNDLNNYYNRLSDEEKIVFDIEFKKQVENFKPTNIYISNDIKDGKQCSKCDTIYERPHWVQVLCVDCFEEMLKESIVPEFPKASGVEL